ncbi:hypothetical protein [Psychroflexus aestuariivivens]|nr:hypothetical protein [Psychroflexus aestuariivivens]
MEKSPYHQDSMFKGASPEIFIRAKKLRQNYEKQMTLNLGKHC